MVTLTYVLFLVLPKFGSSYRQDSRALHDLVRDDSDCTTPKTVMFVRHGESINNIVSQSCLEAWMKGQITAAGRALNRYRRSMEYLKKKNWSTVRDSPLSFKGWRDMQAVGDLLFKDGNKSIDKFNIFSQFKKVLVSPLRRTQGTAFQIFGKAARTAQVPFEVQPWAHEQRKSQSDTGEKTSVLIDFAKSIAKRYGYDNTMEPMKTLLQSLSRLDENWATDKTVPTTDLPYYPPDEHDADSYMGKATRETNEQMAQRLEKLKEELCRDPYQNLILVTHSAVIRSLLPELFENQKPANGGMFVATLERNGNHLVLSSPMAASKFLQASMNLSSMPTLPDYRQHEDKQEKRKTQELSSNPAKKHLRVTILSATGLPNKDWAGKSDPYCTVKVEGGRRWRQTKVISNNLNPVWNQSLNFEDYKVGKNLVFNVWDKDILKFDDPLGDVTLSSDKFLPNGSGEQALELPLNNTGNGTNATLKVKVVVLAQRHIPQGVKPESEIVEESARVNGTPSPSGIATVSNLASTPSNPSSPYPYSYPYPYAYPYPYPYTYPNPYAHAYPQPYRAVPYRYAPPYPTPKPTPNPTPNPTSTLLPYAYPRPYPPPYPHPYSYPPPRAVPLPQPPPRLPPQLAQHPYPYPYPQLRPPLPPSQPAQHFYPYHAGPSQHHYPHPYR